MFPLLSRCQSTRRYHLLLFNRQIDASAPRACRGLFPETEIRGHSPRSHTLAHKVTGSIIRSPGSLVTSLQKRSDRNSINRSQQVLIHKSGRKSFTQNKVEMRQDIQREPYRFELFQKVYKGKKGYANSPTRIATEKLVELAIDNPENEDQTFVEVFGQEHEGRKRGMGRGIASCQNSEPSLRSQVEKLTQLQAERDKKDMERDQNDAEMRNQMKEIKAQLDILLNQRTPVFSHVPHQHQMTYNQQYQMPNQLQMQTSNYQHQTQIPYPQQQMQFPIYQPQMQFPHQNETFQQQM